MTFLKRTGAIILQKHDCEKIKTLQDCSFLLKASVHIKACGNDNDSVIVKDFSHSPWILRVTLCKVFLHREISALKRLQGVKGIPQYLGRYGKNGFVMQLIDGVHPTKKDFKNSKELTDQFQMVLKGMHAAGVAHNDVRMKNIIIDDKQQFFMIDYAASFIVGDSPSILYFLKLPLFKLLKFIDESRVVEFKQLHYENSISNQRQAFFFIVKKMHVIVDGWKLFLKLFRKK